MDEVVENGVVTQLRFVDEYSGYWELNNQSTTAKKLYLRIAHGISKYHIDTFYDESSGFGASMENCFTRVSTNPTQREKSSKGLWFVLNTADENGDPTSSEDGWTLNGSKLEYTRYLDGELLPSWSKTYSPAFNGLAVDGLQICDES